MGTLEGVMGVLFDEEAGIYERPGDYSRGFTKLGKTKIDFKLIRFS